MNIKSSKFLIIAALTFVIVFLMNYIGNEEADKLSRALLNAFAGVIGLTIGMWILYRNRDDKGNQQHFD